MAFKKKKMGFGAQFTCIKSKRAKAQWPEKKDGPNFAFIGIHLGGELNSPIYAIYAASNIDRSGVRARNVV